MPQYTNNNNNVVYGYPVSANNVVCGNPLPPERHNPIQVRAPPTTTASTARQGGAATALPAATASTTTRRCNNATLNCFTHRESTWYKSDCCVFLSMLAVCIVISCALYAPEIVIAIRNLHDPEFKVESLIVSSFDFPDPNKLTANWNINLSVRNRNTYKSFVYNDFEIEVFHDGENLSRGQVASFDQPPKNQTFVDARLSASALNLSDSTAGLMGEERSHGGIHFQVNIQGELYQTYGSESVGMLMRVICEDVKVVILPRTTVGSTLGSPIPCSTRVE